MVLYSHTPHPAQDHNTPQSKSDVLYLPPLLSSLPDRYSAAEAPLHSSFPPILTKTRLPDIDLPSLSLHKALHRFKPLTPDYANTPYAQAFNWYELRLPKDEEREWYCVIFRSKRKAGTESTCDYYLYQNPWDTCLWI